MSAQPPPRLGHRGSVASRAADIALKTVAALTGLAALIGAFVLSLAFFVFAFVAVLLLIAYLWWKTRGLRRQMRAHDQSASPQSSPDVIEGVVVSSRWRDRERDSHASEVTAKDLRTGTDDQ